MLAVHQPQYMPWLGYFHKIANCDLFIFLDDVQYKKREFQNRNQVKTPKGAVWLTVPVITKDKFHQKINEVLIDNSTDWRKEHLKTLEHNYAHAKYYKDHIGFFRDLYGRSWDRLTEISMAIISYTLSYLKINTPYRYSSEFQVTTQSTQRLIDLCKKTGADSYLSGPGGRSYMEEDMFKDSGIRLTYQNFEYPAYPQLYGPFEPYLASVDMLFNCGPESRGILLGKGKG